MIRAEEMLERLRALPAAQPLLARAQPGVHVVGGAVRDLLLGGRPYDLDLVVEGDAAAFARSLGGALRMHDRFGTSTVALEGFSYDIARARSETYARPGALPDVSPASLDEDLLRRDFTVNAMAIALDSGAFSAVPEALEDLDARRLRVLHDRSFIDDPTRMLRLARYAARLGFAVEPHTCALVEEAVRGGAVWTVSGPRLGAELRLLSREPDPIPALRALNDLGVARAIYQDWGQGVDGWGPGDAEIFRRAVELLPEDGGRDRVAHELLPEDADRDRRTLELPEGGRRDRVALALASRGMPPHELARLLDRLGFTAADRDVIVAAATRSADLARVLGKASFPSEIATAAAGAAPELVALAGALGPAEPAREWLERLRHIRLDIDGNDLVAAGIPAGPAIGRGLRAALAAKLDGLAVGRGAELAVALEAARETG